MIESVLLFSYGPFSIASYALYFFSSLMTRLRIFLLIFLGFILGVFYVLYVGEKYVQDGIITGAKNGYQNVIERLSDQPIEDNVLDESLQGIASGSYELLTN